MLEQCFQKGGLIYGEVSSEPNPPIGCALTFLIAALVVVPVRLGSDDAGGVSGTVRDLSGAVIPNASVTLTNTATNVVATSNTNEVGFYIFPAVMPGSYTLSAHRRECRSSKARSRFAWRNVS